MTLPASYPLLGVNIDHSATLRQARYRHYPLDRGRMVEPDPVAVALLAQRAGADGITLHLREDRRHIQDSDVWRMREMIQAHLNLEMAATQAMVALATEVAPEVVLFVPEGREEVTTDGGLDVAANRERLRPMVAALHEAGIAISLFIDPEAEAIDAAASLGVAFVELHTGAFANAWHDPAGRQRELERLRIGAVRAHEVGLRVNAGHGINYHNIREVRTLPHLYELNIGHSIISRAVMTGIEEAVREMKARIRGE
mgnify:CR=1 FL=1